MTLGDGAALVIRSRATARAGLAVLQGGPAGPPGADGADGVMASIVPGNNIDVDATDPANPVVSVEGLTLADVGDVTASPAEVNVLDGVTATTTELNYVDGVTSAVQTQIDGKASRTGGGREAKANAPATTGSVTLDLSAASVFQVTPTGNITSLAFSNVPASGIACTVTFIVNQDGTPRTIATPTGGVFLGAATPTQVANKTCVFTYLTTDGGTTWYCTAAVQV